MSVAGSNVRERTRLAGGGTTDLVGGMPSTGLTARALARAGGHALSSQARAAVRGALIEPRGEAVVKYEHSRRLLPQPFGDPVYYAWNIWGISDPGNNTTSPDGVVTSFGMGYRRNPAWRPHILDETPLDTAQIGPGTSQNPIAGGDEVNYPRPLLLGGIREGVPNIRIPNTPLVRPVANPEAATGGAAWTAAAGTYSRPSVPALPALGLPGSGAHRVSGTISTHGLTSPWVPCLYRLTKDRLFTAAAWVTASVPGSTYRLVLEMREQNGTTIHTYNGPPQVVDGPTRLVASVLGPATLTAPVAVPNMGYSARIRVEVVTAASGGTGTLDVRGAHYYAGPDRGDTEGLRAAPIPFSVYASGVVLQPTSVNRLDFHGVDDKGISAAFAYITDGANTTGPSAVGHVGGPGGRMTLRLNKTVPVRVYTQAQPFNIGLVYLEEVNTGPGGYLWLTAIELSREADLTARLVSFEVDRALDADPSDSTVPIGNYAATAASLELDNTDRALSPMRSRDPDIGLDVELAAGVTYTNRHADPLGEGLDAAAWVGTLAAPPADRYGMLPPAARGARGGTTAAARVRVNPGEQWYMTAWVTAIDPGANPHYTVRAVWSNSGGTVLAQEFGTQPGNRWDFLAFGGPAPAGASRLDFQVTTNTGVAWIVAPHMQRRDPATDQVIEVVETAPAGVFSSVDWPTATDSDTVRVSLLDVLAGSRGSQALAQRLWTDVEVGVSIAIVAREYLDLGDDELVIPATTVSLPLTLPTTSASQMIADLAKAGTLTAFTDGSGRLVCRARADVSATPDAEYREDNALIRAGLPFAPDLIRNVANVTGHPVTFVPDYELATVANDDPTNVAAAGWRLTGQEIRVPYGGSVSLIVTWEPDAALDAVAAVVRGYRVAQVGVVNPPLYADNLAVDHTYTVPKASGGLGGVTFVGRSWVRTAVEVYPTFGRITFSYETISDLLPGDVVIDHVELRGTAAIVGAFTQEYTRGESVEVYGRKPVSVDVRLAQSLGQLSTVATDILDNYSLRDPAGERWLPDLEAEVLGDPWRELGDRVLAREPDSGIGGEYRVVSHKLTVGKAMSSSLYLRRVVTGVSYLTLDSSTLDGPDVLGY